MRALLVLSPGQQQSAMLQDNDSPGKKEQWDEAKNYPNSQRLFMKAEKQSV